MFALAKGHVFQAIQFNALSPVGFAMIFSSFLAGSLRARLWALGVPAYAIYGVLRIFVPSI